MTRDEVLESDLSDPNELTSFHGWIFLEGNHLTAQKVFGMRGLFIFLLTIAFGVAVAQESAQVTISAWQFCEGCKITVDAYAQLASQEIKRLDKLPKKKENTLDALKVMDHMCDDVYFRDYKDFAKYSCIKILDDTRNKFLEEFTGSATLASLSSKKDVVAKKKNVRIILCSGSTKLRTIS